VTDEQTLLEQLDVVQAATALAADDIVGRDKDGSFLEKTLRDALAARLPNAQTEYPLNLDHEQWPDRLGGVDVLYIGDSGARIGVETKVWVADSLYDIFKLAAGTQIRRLAAGFCVIAGRSRDWRAASAIRDMSDTTTHMSVEREVATVLRNDEREWTSIWSRTAIRLIALPTRIRTVAGEPVAMPRAPDYEIRLIGVQAVSRERLSLDQFGAAVGAEALRSSADRT
jgi:hypothetical protein